MNIDTIKIELIDWITKLEDQQTINKLLELKKRLSIRKSRSKSKIYGSGKDLVDYIAEDFNESLDQFNEYKK